MLDQEDHPYVSTKPKFPTSYQNSPYLSIFLTLLPISTHSSKEFLGILNKKGCNPSSNFKPKFSYLMHLLIYPFMNSSTI